MDKEVKSKHHADDMTLTLKHIDSVDKALETIRYNLVFT